MRNQRKQDEYLSGGALTAHPRASAWLTDVRDAITMVQVPVVQLYEVEGWSEVAPDTKGIILRAWEAASRWALAGGRKGELARRKRAAVDSKRRQLLAARARVSDYASQVQGPIQWGGEGGRGRAVVGVSGTPLESVRVRWEIDLTRRKRRRPKGRRGWWSRGSDAADSDEAEDEPGYDRWGFWPVDGPFEVRRAPSKGWRGRLEARIRWQGVDESTQLPWPEQWVSVRDNGEYNVMNGALRKEARRMEAAKYGCGHVRSTTKAPSSGRRPTGTRRCSRLQEREEREDKEAEWVPRPPRRRRRVSAALASDDESDSEMLRVPQTMVGWRRREGRRRAGRAAESRGANFQGGGASGGEG